MAHLFATPPDYYVCRHCGKKSKDNYGCEPISPGFDESCALNCELASEMAKRVADSKPLVSP